MYSTPALDQATYSALGKNAIGLHSVWEASSIHLPKMGSDRFLVSACARRFRPARRHFKRRPIAAKIAGSIGILSCCV